MNTAQAIGCWRFLYPALAFLLRFACRLYWLLPLSKRLMVHHWADHLWLKELSDLVSSFCGRRWYILLGGSLSGAVIAAGREKVRSENVGFSACLYKSDTKQVAEIATIYRGTSAMRGLPAIYYLIAAFCDSDEAEFDRMKDVLETVFKSRKRVKLGSWGLAGSSPKTKNLEECWDN